VAFAALAATFWLLVATVRLIVHAPAPVVEPPACPLVAGMNAVRPQVRACYERFHVPGTAMVNVAIAKSGRVSSAQVTGKFAGTPTGACVEAAVKTARFPPSDGFVTPWSFQFR
jgi:hypothetical protein